MRGTLLLGALLVCSATGCARYGGASPESCHAKYVRDRKGDPYVDNYANCMARFEKRQEDAQKAARGELPRRSMFPWRRQPAVVVSNDVTVNVQQPPAAPPPETPTNSTPPQAPADRIFGAPTTQSL